jgi:hypothetical protein
MLALGHALERALAALESGDPCAASAAMDDARRACDDAERRGARIDAASLERLRDLHRRGAATAEGVAEKLSRALGSAGCARRAVSAYRR